ncbi:DUF2189 domain-containing protein [Ahrensia sp. R2A130]|uniref:DUF2189 domain-containing protein n=1 Tax=Ahrensia sp. R2A130 TaxID=744979 RepID=UPI0001E0C9E3|nr:DUF2189 domain-containing protein [Ahrensia sp. R2A130]EFL89397.1 cytochrome c oxidase subunit I [Ahrensia sp. R2A130]
MTEVPQQKQVTIAINAATVEDLKLALKAGWKDFSAAPQYGIFFGVFFALGGALLVWLAFILDVVWVTYPLTIGFALIGPFIATGLYEVSRRLQSAQPLSWPTVLFVMVDQHRRELGWMAFVTLFVFWVWMYQARTIFVVFFGSKGFATLDGFVAAVFSTETGWWFLLVGHAVGAVISLVLYTLTVISCPLLLDRDVDFVTAMITSVRAVLASPFVMIIWGVFVIVTVLLSMLPAFLGLLFVLPVLGHATWHLYGRVITVQH